MVPQNRETGKENREQSMMPMLMLGESKSDYPKWKRHIDYSASLLGLTEMINEPRKVLLTREQWGAPQTPKAGVEHSLYIKTDAQDAVRACELIRKGLITHSTADIIARNSLDSVKPHEAIIKLSEHFNKPDVGMLVDKVAALLAPSAEATTQGVFNESMQMMTEIEPLLRPLPIAAAEPEGDGAAAAMVPPGHMPFYPAFKAAVALCRTMNNAARGRDHSEMCASIVQDISLRYPNMFAHELTINHLNSTLTANMRAKPRGETANVFQTIAAPAITRATTSNVTKWAPRAVRVRSPDANPKAPCEIHPDAKVPHTNGECRQNLANKKTKTNERTTKLMMVCEESDSSSSEMAEIYQFEDGKFLDGSDTNDCDSKRKRDEGVEPRPSTSAVSDYFETMTGEFSRQRNGHVIDTHDDSSSDGYGMFLETESDDDDDMLQVFFANYCNDKEEITDNERKIEPPQIHYPEDVSEKKLKVTDLKCDGYRCKCHNFKIDFNARMIAGSCFPCECGHSYEVHHLADPSSNYRQSAYFRIEEEIKRHSIAKDITYCEKPEWHDHKTAFQMRDEAEEFEELIQRRRTVARALSSSFDGRQNMCQIEKGQEDKMTAREHASWDDTHIGETLSIIVPGKTIEKVDKDSVKADKAEEGEVVEDDDVHWQDHVDWRALNLNYRYLDGQGWYSANPLSANAQDPADEAYSPDASECDYSDLPPLVSDDSSDSDSD